MSYLKFNKEELVNLEYSLGREILLSNRAGGYANTTIVGCNTRKYHGLLVVPISEFCGEKHILLSNLHETLVQHGKSFNLGINSYGKVYEPRGHKYIVDFEMDFAPTITYQVGGMKFSKTLFFARATEEILIKYTLLEAHSPTKLLLKPFLAFRNIHALTEANAQANTKFAPIDNGVSFKMYEGFPTLNLQLNKKSTWVASPDWYRGITYKEESRRGFADKEDLFVPGYFEVPIKVGESIIFSAGTKEVDHKALLRRFDAEMAMRDGSRGSFDACLKLAAKQFVVKEGDSYAVCSGYTWDYEDLRATLISAAGLTLYNDGNVESYRAIIDNAIGKMERAVEEGNMPDLPLWLVWSLQQWIRFGAKRDEVWGLYGEEILKRLFNIMESKVSGLYFHENGLLWSKKGNTPLSWMNVTSNGAPVTERAGYQVEVNALWYNALCFAHAQVKDEGVKARLKDIMTRLENNFTNYFWIPERGHLADYFDEGGRNLFMRPNQLFACAAEYSPLSEELQMQALKNLRKELLTVRGIRSLSPKNPIYKGVYEGDQSERDHAHHNGCAFPFLLGAYLDAFLKLEGPSIKKNALALLNAFEEDITIHGIGSVAELYDGDPSHHPHGCISYSASVAEIIRLKSLLNSIKMRKR